MEVVLHALGLCGEPHLSLLSMAGLISVIVKYRKLLIEFIKRLLWE